ncbi:MAG TPA: hypothetical protein IAC14_00200 [Candidatus Scybalomonas excrementigallinarum]|nr:hypothetical protein [Candidatus Scybalomonas excrementigallinarum]
MSEERATVELEYLNELKAKAKAWDNYLKEEEARAEEDIKLIFSASFHQLVDERVKEIKDKYMEDE